jgi:O-antigen/teichoic acid export membrane protein
MIPPANKVETKAQTLTQRTFSAFFWTLSGTGFLAVVEAVVLIVLARILTPRDFGVVSAATVFIKLCELVNQAGISQAIVQRPNLETRHLETGFTLCCLTGLVVTGVVAGLSQVIAGFFRTEELAAILPIMALGFLIQGPSLVAEGLLQREIRFRSLAAIDALSSGIGYGLLGVILALKDYGVWSLVMGYVGRTTVRTILLLIARPHSMRPRLDRRSLNELLYFGSGFTIARICNTIAGQGGPLVVGRCLGAEALGIYSRAYQLMAMPANLFGLALDKVSFPVMAIVQHDRERLTTAYRTGVAVVALVILPVSAMMYVLAPEIITVLFGSKWLEVVIPFKILSLAILFRTSCKMSDSLTRATGAVYRRAWRQGVYAAAILAGAWAGQFWGLEGVSVGILSAITVNFLLMAHLSMQITSITCKDFLASHLPALLSAAMAWTATTGSAMILRGMAMPPIVVLLVSISLVVLIMLVTIYFIPQFILGNDAKVMLRSLYRHLPDKIKLRTMKITPSYIHS